MHPLKSSSNFWTIENGKRGGTEQNRKYNLWGHNHSNKVFEKSLHSIYNLLSLVTASFHKRPILYGMFLLKKHREIWYVFWIGLSWKYIVNVKLNWNTFSGVFWWTSELYQSKRLQKQSEWNGGVSSVYTLYHSFAMESGLRYNWSVKRIFCASLSFLP